ncbi:hypothetical protein B0H67DRAFT_648123 [Lasiosphaeris hirsuta]|uniref:2EXR domain-containing protein n=1 Tax=Lasiosphaeris hirsuta TaxID=260670 RepID=A0AA40A2A9_9PEZI|nr:hypothetical protein B0H67DRAFT_648123 [Lasiosphaeris hirsuta]
MPASMRPASQQKPPTSSKAKMPRAAPSPKNKGNTVVTRFQPYRRCAQRPPRFSLFLRLPPELRLQVYDHLLRMPGALDVCGIWNDRPRTDVALLRVCRQIHIEASHVLYSTNTFCFLEHCDDFNDDMSDPELAYCRSWLRSIGSTNAGFIRNVHLRLREERPTKYYVDLLHGIAGCTPNITRLALVSERHASSGRLVNGHFTSVWEPSQVNPTSECVLYQLYRSVRLFSLLKVLLLADRRECQEMDRLCALFKCRVQAVEREDASRKDELGSALWSQKMWYDGVPAGKDKELVYRLNGDEASASQSQGGSDTEAADEGDFDSGDEDM